VVRILPKIAVADCELLLYEGEEMISFAELEAANLLTVTIVSKMREVLLGSVYTLG